MATYAVDGQQLTNLANAIRTNDWTKDSMTIDEMAENITSRLNHDLLPIWDNANNCYKLFPYTIVYAGCKPSGTAQNVDGVNVYAQIKFGFKILFDEEHASEAYALIAQKDSEGNSLARLDIDYMYTITSTKYRYTFDVTDSSIIKYGNAASTTTALTLTIDKLSLVSVGEKFTSGLIISSPTGFRAEIESDQFIHVEVG